MAAAQLVLTDLDWSEHCYLLSLFSHYHSTGVAVVLRSHCNNLGYHLCLVDPDRRPEVLCQLWKSLEDGLDRNSCDRCLRILVHYLNVKDIHKILNDSFPFYNLYEFDTMAINILDRFIRMI